MTDDTRKPRRIVMARREVALGAMAAAATVTAGQAAVLAPVADDTAKWVHTASGEGEGEGEGEGAAPLDPEIRYLRDLGFMEGHLRAGVALYETGDTEAAKTHMGHPIKEKYAAVAQILQAEGYGNLKAEIGALAEAAEGGAELAEIRWLHQRVTATISAARGEKPAASQLRGLVELTRIAGDEYTLATKGGDVSNLHEYQDAWGFMQVVRDEAARLAVGDGPAAGVAERMVGYAETAAAALGDLQGQGITDMDAGILFGAAARMELAAARLD